MKFLFTRILVGIPVSYVVLIPFAGVTDAAMFIVLSIVCTLGISLVVWLPIWFVLGWIVLAISEAAGLTGASKKPPGIATQQDRDLIAVIDYLGKAEASGLSDEQITRELEAAGWSVAMIDEARKLRANLSSDSQTHTP